MYARKLLLCLILVSVCLFGAQTLAAQALTCDGAVDYAAEGAELYTAGDYGAAVDAYYCALDSEPLNTDYLLARAESAVLSGRYMDFWHPYDVLATYFPEVLTARLEELRAQHEANPSALDTLLLSVTTSFYVADPEEYEENLHMLLQAAPDNAFANVLQGEDMFSLEGDFEAARPYYERALELGSENAHIWGWVGNDYASGGELDLALEYLNHAIELSPNTAKFYQIVSETQFNYIGDREASVPPALRAVELDPNDWILIVNLVIMANDDELSAADAAPLLDRLVALLPEGTRLVSVFRMLGYHKLGDDAMAAAELARYSDINSESVTDGGGITSDHTSEGEMTYGQVLRYTIPVAEGESIMVQARNPEAVINPIIAIISPAGEGVAMSDDLGAEVDYATSAMFTAAETGTYTVFVTHDYFMEDGTIEVSIEDS